MDLQARSERWLRRTLAPMLMVASATVPAGIPDDSEPTRQWVLSRDVALRSAAAVEQARVDALASRYRRPPEQIRSIVRAAERVGRRYALPPELILAIVETESGFDPAARSGYGARGLMQVVPRHHPTTIAAIGGAHRLHDVEAGIDAGARILAAYLERSPSPAQALRRYSGNASRYADKVFRRQRSIEQLSIQATRHLDASYVVSAYADSAQSGRSSVDLPNRLSTRSTISSAVPLRTSRAGFSSIRSSDPS